MKACAQSSQNTGVTPFYPDCISGLEHLLQDILKLSEKAGDGVPAADVPKVKRNYEQAIFEANQRERC